MTEDKYTKNLAKNQLCVIIHVRDIRKNFLPKFIRLCKKTPCLCPFERHKHGRRKPSCLWFSYLYVNSSLEELRKIKVILIPKQEIDSKNLKKSATFNNPHKSFPGRQLDAASSKSLEIQVSSIAKRRTLWNRKFV